jgi:hypothetical protein
MAQFFFLIYNTDGVEKLIISCTNYLTMNEQS